MLTEFQYRVLREHYPGDPGDFAECYTGESKLRHQTPQWLILRDSNGETLHWIRGGAVARLLRGGPRRKLRHRNNRGR